MHAFSCMLVRIAPVLLSVWIKFLHFVAKLNFVFFSLLGIFAFFSPHKVC